MQHRGIPPEYVVVGPVRVSDLVNDAILKMVSRDAYPDRFDHPWKVILVLHHFCNCFLDRLFLIVFSSQIIQSILFLDFVSRFCFSCRCRITGHMENCVTVRLCCPRTRHNFSLGELISSRSSRRPLGTSKCTWTFTAICRGGVLRRPTVTCKTASGKSSTRLFPRAESRVPSPEFRSRTKKTTRFYTRFRRFRRFRPTQPTSHPPRSHLRTTPHPQIPARDRTRPRWSSPRSSR